MCWFDLLGVAGSSKRPGCKKDVAAVASNLYGFFARSHKVVRVRP